MFFLFFFLLFPPLNSVMNVTRVYFQPGEVATISIGAILLLLQVITTVFLVVQRSYGPFRAKQLDLVAASVMVECIWFIGLLQSVKLVPEVGAWANCSLWQLWFNLSFGFFAWASILMLRFLKMHLSFNLKKRWVNWKMNLCFFAFWSPSVVWALVGTVLQDRVFSEDPQQNSICEMNGAFLYSLVILASCFVVLYVVRDLSFIGVVFFFL